MDESETTPPVEETAAVTTAPVAEEKPLAGETLDLNKIQDLDPEGFDALCQRLNFRPQPGRTHHQHIFDVVRFALARGCTVTVEGFIEQTSENFAMLRSPRLNFLPVPQDVFVPRVVLQLYKLRFGPTHCGHGAPATRSREIIMLDEVTSIEGLPPEEWRSRQRSTI